MANKIKLGVIFGGRSGEHEVSLMSARSVLSVIDRDKYEVFPIGVTIGWTLGCGRECPGFVGAKEDLPNWLARQFSATLPDPGCINSMSLW